MQLTIRYTETLTKDSLIAHLENDGYRNMAGVYYKRQDGLVRIICPGTLIATVTERLEEK